LPVADTGVAAVELAGRPIQGLRGGELRPLRREMQIVFQDRYGSLSPRTSIRQIVEEGMLLQGVGATARERDDLVVQALEEVDVDPRCATATRTSSSAASASASPSPARSPSIRASSSSTSRPRRSTYRYGPNSSTCSARS